MNQVKKGVFKIFVNKRNIIKLIFNSPLIAFCKLGSNRVISDLMSSKYHTNQQKLKKSGFLGGLAQKHSMQILILRNQITVL